MTRNIKPPIRTSLIILFLTFCYTLSIRAVLAQEARLRVERVEWTSGINSRGPTSIHKNTAPVAPLYLWMQVNGSNWALQCLQDAGKLPIYHQWFRQSIVKMVPEGATEMIDSIRIPAGDAQEIDDLRTEMTSQGFFNWRTWSMKENMRRGDWVVKVVYADGTPVLCHNDMPCEYRISVK